MVIKSVVNYHDLEHFCQYLNLILFYFFNADEGLTYEKKHFYCSKSQRHTKHKKKKNNNNAQIIVKTNTYRLLIWSTQNLKRCFHCHDCISFREFWNWLLDVLHVDIIM